MINLIKILNKSMSRITGSVITPEDFKRERARIDRELLDRIAKSKSVNKIWLADSLGFDVDYTPDEREPNKREE